MEKAKLLEALDESLVTISEAVETVPLPLCKLYPYCIGCPSDGVDCDTFETLEEEFLYFSFVREMVKTDYI
jgi:hypothetical protein